MTGFELHRTEVADRGVPAAGVVEGLHALEDRGRQLMLRLPPMSVQEFELQGPEERLGHAVVEAVADGAHGPQQARGPKAPAEGPGGHCCISRGCTASARLPS